MEHVSRGERGRDRVTNNDISEGSEVIIKVKQHHRNILPGTVYPVLLTVQVYNLQYRYKKLFILSVESTVLVYW